VKTTPTLARRLRQVAATLTSPGQIDTLLYASALLTHGGGRPPQRFVIRRISIGAKTNLPWTLTDIHRPSYIGRYPTQATALAEVDTFDSEDRVMPTTRISSGPAEQAVVITHPDGEVVFELHWDGTTTSAAPERVADALEHAFAPLRGHRAYPFPKPAPMRVGQHVRVVEESLTICGQTGTVIGEANGAGLAAVKLDDEGPLVYLRAHEVREIQ